MFIYRCTFPIVVACILVASEARKNPLLIRKRRYLLFPEGSNLVMTISGVKHLLAKVPKGTNFLMECDVPFKLPSDSRLFKGTKRRQPQRRQKREILDQLESAFQNVGLNGSACIRQLICEAHNALPATGKSLVGDLLSALFKFSLEDPLESAIFYKYCSNYRNSCDVPLLNFILGAFTSE